MKTKTFLFAVLIGFMCASCVDEVEITKYYDCTFELTSIQSSTPLESKQNFIRIDTVGVFSMCQDEINAFIYDASLPIYGETPTCKLKVIRKCRLIKAD